MAGKSDLTAAFRNLAILKRHWRYLLMKARNPLDKKFYFFVDKCMPFGVSISCAHFQAFSDALAHIVEWIYELKMGVKKPLTNYLNDFLFIALFTFMCNRQIAVFMEVCSNINFPVSLEKKRICDNTDNFPRFANRYNQAANNAAPGEDRKRNSIDYEYTSEEKQQSDCP